VVMVGVEESMLIINVTCRSIKTNTVQVYAQTAPTVTLCCSLVPWKSTWIHVQRLSTNVKHQSTDVAPG
jgi:hypothetical protein